MADKKPFIAVDHGNNKIDLSHLQGRAFEFRPVEIHHKADDSVKDQPSFTIVMKHGYSNVYGQISLEMLNEALQDIGYRVIKTA